MIEILTTGGTIDKIYFDALSEFAVGESLMEHILKQAHVGAPYQITAIMQKDSLELNDKDRHIIRAQVEASTSKHILITHGTDTMSQTAEALMDVQDKCIVLCGSMQPARMQETDAHFNIGAAFSAVQCLNPGVYIVMNGQIFKAGQVQKNRSAKRFESI